MTGQAKPETLITTEAPVTPEPAPAPPEPAPQLTAEEERAVSDAETRAHAPTSPSVR